MASTVRASGSTLTVRELLDALAPEVTAYLHRSTGARPVVVKDATGRDYDVAEAACSAVGLSVRVEASWADGDEVEVG